MSTPHTHSKSFALGGQRALMLPAILAFIIDVASKQVASDLLAGRGVMDVAPFLNLRLAYNPGVSFGLFPVATQSQASMLVLATALMTVAITWLGLTAREPWQKVGFGLIVGGAAANVLDRLTDTLVTDFIDVHAFGWHWPTFNMADAAITCGVSLLLMTLLGLPDRRPT